MLAELAVTATPPPLDVTSRDSLASVVSRATPTATDAPTAVLSAETSPFAVDSVFVCVLAAIVTLSAALSPVPDPI